MWNPADAFKINPTSDDYSIIWKDERIFIRNSEGLITDPSSPLSTKDPLFSVQPKSSLSEFVETNPERRNMIEALEWIANIRGSMDDPFMGIRVVDENKKTSYRYESYKHCFKKSAKLANSLHKRKLIPSKQYDDAGYRSAENLRMLGICMRNCREYFYAEYACQMTGTVLLPMYSTLGKESMVYVMEQTMVETIIADYESLNTLLKQNHNRGIFPKNIFIVKDADAKATHDGTRVVERLKEEFGCTVICFDELLKEEPLPRNQWHQWRPDQVWTICYTSGTTGRPKGVMIKQKSLMDASVATIIGTLGDKRLFDIFEQVQADGTDLTYFSYLPMAHIFERISAFSSASMGFRIAPFNGPLTQVLDALKASECNLFIAVPKILETIYKRLMAELNTKMALVKRFAFGLIDLKKARYQKCGDVEQYLADALMMKKLKSRIIGPNVKVIVTGGAPLGEEVKLTCQALLCVPILNGYGMTESTSACTVQHSSNHTCNIGHPLPTVVMKLIDVPNLNKVVTDKKKEGELCLKGHVVTVGYFRNAEETKKAFTEDGFFRTGDVVSVRENGMKILDRVKACVKLSQGEYIALEKIECLALLHPVVEQICVLADSHQSYAVALIALNAETEKGLDKIDGIGPRASKVRNEERKQIAQDIQDALRAQGLHGFEVPKYYAFLSRAMTVDDKLITPTFKTRRGIIGITFSDVKDELYQGHHLIVDLDAHMEAVKTP